MSRLTIMTKDKARETVEELYKDVERRIAGSQPGLCPVDLAAAFLHMCHAQSCGKCTPCRVGLGQLEILIESVLDGTATMETLKVIEDTAAAVYYSADCAIGSEAARMVMKGLEGFRDDYIEHIQKGRCTCVQDKPVPCVSQCPAHVDVPGYIALIAEGRYSDAVELIRKNNPFPAACALICEHPCEIHCRRKMVDDSINIRGLKRFAVENEGEEPAPKILPSTGKKIAVVGGGPSGLSAAFYLSIMGHDVTVYEQRKQLGGMLRYGIPTYRLPRKWLDREIRVIMRTGMKVKTGVAVGKDISLAELREQNDALYIAIGAHTDKKIGIEGEDAIGVTSAVEMLRAIGDDEMPDYSGKDIIVVGGGNVAMDVARSSIRLGAKSVKIVYRRRQSDMTALEEEVVGAIAEGCEVLELHAPIRIEKNDDNTVKGLVVKPQIVGKIKGGRPAPDNASVDEFLIPCDKILVAVGQGIDSSVFEEFGIPVKKGAISAMNTSGVQDQDGIFSGGDCVTGPATVIRAIAGGKVAAANIDEYLGFNHEIENFIEIPPAHFDDRTPMGRVNMKEVPAAERKCNFNLMECCLTEEEAKREASRCLHCDHFGYGIFKGGRREKW